MKSQFEKMSLELNNYNNTTHYASEFDGNYWAAQVAGQLFHKWTAAQCVADQNLYQNDEFNRNAEEAEEEYDLFVATFKSVQKKTYRFEYQSLFHDIEITQESFLMGTR